MKRITIAIVVAALALTACQSAGEVLTEQIAEQVEGIDNVEIDTDTGQVKLETEDGNITIGGGEVPDGFDIPLPDGFVVNSVFQSEDSSAVNAYVEDGDFDAIVDFYAGWIGTQSGDWSESSSDISGSDGETIRSHSWSSDDSGSFINIGNLCIAFLAGGGDDFGAVCVDVVQSEG